VCSRLVNQLASTKATLKNWGKIRAALAVAMSGVAESRWAAVDRPH
jgi:hypothetical protein